MNYRTKQKLEYAAMKYAGYNCGIDFNGFAITPEMVTKKEDFEAGAAAGYEAAVQKLRELKDNNWAMPELLQKIEACLATLTKEISND